MKSRHSTSGTLPRHGQNGQKSDHAVRAQSHLHSRGPGPYLHLMKRLEYGQIKRQELLLNVAGPKRSFCARNLQPNKWCELGMLLQPALPIRVHRAVLQQLPNPAPSFARLQEAVWARTPTQQFHDQQSRLKPRFKVGGHWTMTAPWCSEAEAQCPDHQMSPSFPQGLQCVCVYTYIYIYTHTHPQVTSCVPMTEQFPMTRLPQLYLKVLKATGEVQDVPQVSLGIPAGACGLSLLQLLGDCVELQGSNGEDLASPQELFSCNSHSPTGEHWVPAPLCSQGSCPPGQQ